jgi:hypothetical protein
MLRLGPELEKSPGPVVWALPYRLFEQHLGVTSSTRSVPERWRRITEHFEMGKTASLEGLIFSFVIRVPQHLPQFLYLVP